MKRKIGFLLVLLGIIVAVVVLLKVLTGRSGKQGVLKVNSSPAASVFLENKHIGRTPFEDKVANGEYTIKIVPESSSTQTLAGWQGKITVVPNTLTYVNRDLTESELSSAGEVLWLEKISSKQSEISVTTIPDGANLILDDGSKSVTPVALSNITPAEHTLTVTSPGFLTRTLKVKTTAGYKLIATIQLGLSPGGAQPEASPSPTPTPSGSPKPTPKATPTKAATSSATIKDPAKPFIIIKDTPTGFLRVRMEPATSATESGRVKPGEKYTIVDSKTGWYQIKYDGTNSGWVSGQYTEKVE